MIRRVIVPALICIALSASFVASLWANAPTAASEQTVIAGRDAAVTRFDETAESLYNAAKQSNRQAGYLYIQQLRMMMSKQLQQTWRGSEGWDLMERSAAEVEEALAAGKPEADWLAGAARLRLAADVMRRPEAPLWFSYETVMRDDMNKVIKAWNRTDGQNAESARATLQTLAVHLDRIEAAAKLQQDPGKINEAKAKLAYTARLLEAGKRDNAQTEWTSAALAELKIEILRIFEGTPAAEPLPAVAPIHAGHPVYWMLLLGAIIAGALAFAGYRKYKGQPYGVKPFR